MTAATEIGVGGQVRVLAFAATRDVLGCDELDLDIPAGCTPSGVMDALCARFPALAPYRPSIRLAINGTYAQDGDAVAAGDEIALIPPVAGG